jgi:hypothetical protein
MKFKINTKELKTRELIEIEETTSFAKLNRIMARFLVDDETNEKLPFDEAFDILGDLSVDENQDAQIAFMESFSPNQKSAQR